MNLTSPKNSLYSIITVCRNAEDCIIPSIMSLQSQTFPDYEYIVIDGGSTDNTIDLIKNHCNNKIDVLLSEPDTGIYDAMNKGIEAASGDYIFFLNAGDQFFDKYVLDNVSKFITESEADFIYGNAEIIDQVGTCLSLRSHENINGINQLFYQTITHQAIFAKKSTFEMVGQFNLNYKIRADYDWLIKCFKEKKLKKYYVNLIISKFLIGGVSGRNAVIARKEKFSILKHNFSWYPYYYFYQIKRLLSSLEL